MEPVCELHVDHITADDVHYLLGKMRNIIADKNKAGGLFEFHIRRLFLRDDPALATQDFVKDAANTVEQLARLEEFLSAR